MKSFILEFLEPTTLPGIQGWIKNICKIMSEWTNNPNSDFFPNFFLLSNSGIFISSSSFPHPHHYSILVHKKSYLQQQYLSSLFLKIKTLFQGEEVDVFFLILSNKYS